MRARFPKPSPRAVVAPRRPLVLRAAAVSAAAALAGGPAACGSDRPPSARSLVEQTFASRTPIHSGRLELSFALSPVAPAAQPAPRWPVAARLSGAFQSLGAGRLPQFALRLSVSAPPGRTVAAGAVSTGGRLFVELGGKPFATPRSTSQALARGYAEASRAGALAGEGWPFAPLGIEPARWLIHPVLSRSPAGSGTVHVVAGLDARRFFAGVARLMAAGGSLLGAIAGNGGRAPELFAPAAPAALAASVRSARVDLYSGAADHLLRRLTVSAALSSTGRAGGALAGPQQATVTLVLAFAELNRAQSIVAPRAPRPFAELLPAVARLGLPARSPR